MILIEAARRIELCIRETDLVARLGGDAFVVMLEMIASADGAMEIVSNIIDAISQPYLLKDKRTEIGASIGISIYPLHDISSEALLRKADKASYSAKDGRGRAFDIDRMFSIGEISP